MYQIDPDAKAQAASMLTALGKGAQINNIPEPKTQETLQDKMLLQGQKLQHDMAKERMKQEYDGLKEQVRLQNALGTKAADHESKLQMAKLQSQMQPKVAQRQQPNQVAQQAVDNQYYQDAVQQVPQYLGNYVG